MTTLSELREDTARILVARGTRVGVGFAPTLASVAAACSPSAPALSKVSARSGSLPG